VCRVVLAAVHRVGPRKGPGRGPGPFALPRAGGSRGVRRRRGGGGQQPARGVTWSLATWPLSSARRRILRLLPAEYRASGRRQKVGRGRLGAGNREAGIEGEHDEVGTVVDAELEHRAADVGLGGGGADDELLGDVGVAETARDERDDL